MFTPTVSMDAAFEFAAAGYAAPAKAPRENTELWKCGCFGQLLLCAKTKTIFCPTDLVQIETFLFSVYTTYFHKNILGLGLFSTKKDTTCKRKVRSTPIVWCVT